MMCSWLHSDGSIKTDRLPVHHFVEDDMLHQMREFVRIPQSAGVRNSFSKEGPDFLRQGSEEGSIEETRGDGVDSDALCREIPGQRQSHPNYRSLAGRVGRLTNLTVKGCHTGRVDDDTSLVVAVGVIGAHQSHGKSDDVESPADIHFLNLIKVLQCMCSVLVEIVNFESHSNTRTVDSGVQSTKLCLKNIAFYMKIYFYEESLTLVSARAFSTSAVLVMSVGTKIQLGELMALATAAP